jgi:hypothetical protein
MHDFWLSASERKRVRSLAVAIGAGSTED